MPGNTESFSEITLMLTEPEYRTLESCFQKNHISFYCAREPVPGWTGPQSPTFKTRLLIASDQLQKAKTLLGDIGMYSSEG